jgi:transposase
MKDISQDKRERIIALHLHTSKTQRQIANDLGVSQNVVSLIIRRFQATGSTTTKRKGHCGRKCKLTDREKKMVLRESKKNPRLTAAEIKHTSADIGAKVSVTTIKRILLESGRRAHRPIRAPQLDTTKRVRRRQWARVHLEFGMDFWEKVILF